MPANIFNCLNGLMVEAAGAAGALSNEVDFGGAKVDIHFSYCLLFPGVIASGTNDIQRNVLAKRVLGLH